jgi:uncharacterized protein
MKKSGSLFLLSVFLIFCFSSCSKKSNGYIRSGGPEVVTFRALPFSIGEVQLLSGPFLHATKLNEKILLGYDPDRLLSKFYSEAGLKPKAEHYMGWENETLAGHSLGHYLSACSMMYQTTGDKRFLERVNFITKELKYIQDAQGNGYIGAFPHGRRIFEEEIAKGNIRSKPFDLNGIWAPFYTQHKIMAGLRDAYHLCNDTTAFEVEKHFAGWLNSVLTPLTTDQIQNMLWCEHGGISETLADLYADTKDEKYLSLSKIFYQKAILDSLKAGKDVLPGKHCNTNIPKLIALSRIYELTGDSSDKRAAEFFWNTVGNHHTYVTGGNGFEEYFGPEDKLRNRLGEGTTESCNVYNMLKLSEHLFEWEGSARVADYYERALFNHILSSQNPLTGNVTYNLSLAMGGFKDFQDPFSLTCCVGTGMENHSKYGKNIFYHNDNELFVFQYIASRLSWKERGIILTQNTAYPEEQSIRLEFECEKPVKLTLQIRYPSWAARGIVVNVNGSQIQLNGRPGSFIPVERIWKSGDKVEVIIPFSLRLESMPDDSNRVAVMYGPLVMAGDLGSLATEVSKDSVNIPVLKIENRDPSTWMKPVDGKPNTFITINTGKPCDVEFKPFYATYNRRYSVYWDLVGI